MVFETKPVRITELAKETEQYLLQKGCKKSTLGVYKATWHKFMAFSSSDVYSRTAAEVFLKLYFGVDVHSAIQKLDSRMRHALRHMNALEDYLNTGAVPRKRMRGHYSTVPLGRDRFYCQAPFRCSHIEILFCDKHTETGRLIGQYISNSGTQRCKCRNKLSES